MPATTRTRPRVQLGKNYNGPWFDFQPLDDMLPEGDDEFRAEVLGVSRNTYRRLRDKIQRLTWLQADVYAVNLRLPPSSVWPDWYEKTGAMG